MKKIAFLPLIFAAAPAFSASCDSLAALALPSATITSAQVVAAGEFKAPAGNQKGKGANAFASLPAFCRVAATLKPTSDSDIKIEVWLPVAGWNNKLQSVGNGGADVELAQVKTSAEGDYFPLSSAPGTCGIRVTFDAITS